MTPLQPDVVITLSMGAVAFVKITVDTFAYAFNIEGRYKVPFAMLLGAIYSSLIALTVGGSAYFLSVWPACILAGILSGAAASGMTELQKKVEAKKTEMGNTVNGTNPSVSN